MPGTVHSPHTAGDGGPLASQAVSALVPKSNSWVFCKAEQRQTYKRFIGHHTCEKQREKARRRWERPSDGGAGPAPTAGDGGREEDWAGEPKSAMQSEGRPTSPSDSAVQPTLRGGPHWPQVQSFVTAVTGGGCWRSTQPQHKTGNSVKAPGQAVSELQSSREQDQSAHLHGCHVHL